MSSIAEWTPHSWRDRVALQQPEWPDPAAPAGVGESLEAMPPLVFAGEARALETSLGEVAAGRGFLLQAGDCAESFDDFSAVGIREKLRVILQMAVVLAYAGSLPVVKVGRIDGQFGKPRSRPTETVGGAEVPAFRGHIVHDHGTSAEARVP